MVSLGFRVLKRTRSVSAELVSAFRTVPVANVGDCMARMFAGGPRLRPIHEAETVMSGPALTVRTRPGDNLMVHHALDIASPGDVIVVDAAGDLTTAIIGEIMVAMARKNRVAGIVINGAIRDAGEIRRMGIPVYAAGVTHRGPYKDGPGEVNVPVAIDGMVVTPGDLVLGDGDGVLSVPFEMAEAVLNAATAKKEAEQAQLAAIASGDVDRSWVMRTLRERSCHFEE